MEEIFDLNGISIHIDDDYKFGTDAMLLADYAKQRKNQIVCDLCTGCGIIPLLMCHKPPKTVYAVDIQPEVINLLRKSVEENKLSDTVKPICADLKDLSGEFQRESVDLVTVNPPYYGKNTGNERLSYAQAIARHEILCGINDVVGAADYLLKYGGTLKMCHIPERLTDVMAAMRNRKIEPKELTLVFNEKNNSSPWLFLITGKKGGRPGIKINTYIHR